MMIATDQSSLDRLTPLQQEQVAVIVERCMLSMESGQRFDVDSYVSQYPGLEEPLRRCLVSLQTLHDAVGELTQVNRLASAPGPGARLGDFKLDHEIGRGGMGVVYAATEMSLNRLVALKVLPDSVWLQPKRVQRFQLEAQVAAHLQHPNIIPIYSIGIEGSVRYFAMPLIDGQSLDRLAMQPWPACDYHQLIDIGVSVANALQHAHDLGVIHRDVKPSNLILDRSGKIWVTDFGLAQQAQNPSLTTSGELVGTLNYMSPEQALGQPIDQRTDVYGLAATLYELVTNKKVFQSNSVAETLRKIQLEEPIAPRWLQSAMPVDLETVILKGLSKDRVDRYQSIADMAQDLLAVRDGRPIAGRRPGLWTMAGRWLKKHQMIAAITAILGSFTLLVTLTALVVVMFKQHEVRTALAQSEDSRKAAEDNYWMGRDLLDKWNRDLIPLLADDTSDLSFRQTMLSDSIDYYQHFLDRQTDASDPSLNDAARLTRIRLAEAYAGVQKWPQAVEQLELVVNSRQASLLTGRSTQAQQHLDATALSYLGLGYLQLDSVKAAVDHLIRGIDQYKELLAGQLDHAVRSQILLEQAAAHANLGQAYRRNGQFELCGQQLETAADCCQQIAPGVVYSKSQRLLAQIWDHQATLLSQSDPRQALLFAQQSIEKQRDSYEYIRTNWRQIQQFGNSLHNYAVLLQACGNPNQAILVLEQVKEQRQLVVGLNPKEPNAWADLAITLNVCGMIQADLAQDKDARSSFDEAIELLLRWRESQGLLWSAKSQLALLSIHVNRASVSRNTDGVDWQQQTNSFQRELQHPILTSDGSSHVEEELEKIRSRAEQLELISTNLKQAEHGAES